MITSELLTSFEPEKPKVLLAQLPITSLVPNNPAGITSILRSVYGTKDYRDFNEEFLISWLLKDRPKLQESLKRPETYQDFDAFREVKMAISEAADRTNAPFLGSSRPEAVTFARNSIKHWNPNYRESRRTLVQEANREGIFSDFYNQHVLPSVLEFQPDVIGLSITHPAQLVPSAQFARKVREERPETIIVVGGSTISRRPDTWTRNDELNRRFFRPSREDRSGIFDAIMISDGELPWAQLTAALSRNLNMDLQELLAGVNSVAYNRQGRIVLNELPLPYNPDSVWSDPDIYKYLTSGFMPDGEGVFSIVDGRVCTYETKTGGCSFCAISKGYLELMRGQLRDLGIEQERITPHLLLGTDTEVVFKGEAEVKNNTIRIIEQRKLGPEILANEIVKAKEAGHRVIDITDEQFTLHQAIQLAKELQKRGLNQGDEPDIAYSCYMRVDDRGDQAGIYQRIYGKSFKDLLSDPATAEMLARSGLRFVQFGLESTYKPKMISMTKGTNAQALANFTDYLRNFASHDILTHLFVIAGAPLKDRVRNMADIFGAESRFLGGREVTPNDVEILEACSNLKYLFEVRDSIYTMKHTQYKLSFGSPDSKNPQNTGIRRKDGMWFEKDLGPNVPFEYLPEHGPTSKVVEDLLELYDLWKQEVLPYQLVTQEYMYNQRTMIGAPKIRELAATLPQGEDRLTVELIQRKKEVLRRLWGHLVGREYAEKADKLVRDIARNGSNRPLSKALGKQAEHNPFRSAFPLGFNSYEDLYKAASLLEELRTQTSQ